MKKSLFMALAAIVLAMPSMAQDEEWRWSQDRVASDLSYTTPPNFEGVTPARVPQTVSEAVKALPAVPTVEQIITPEAKEKAIRATHQPYSMALEQMSLRLMKEDEGLRRRQDAIRMKQAQQGQHAMQQYQSNVNAGLMPSQQEMMALYMSGEINENMSDEQMMDVMAGKFAAKWGISKQEYLKIIGMAQSNPKGCEAYIKSNHPDLYKRLYAANAGYNTQDIPDDPRDERLGQIGEELAELQQQLEEPLSNYNYNYMLSASRSQSAYSKMLEQMRADWKTCSEAKQIDAIEDALQKRIDEWTKTLSYDVFDDVPYPAWFGTERKKENALIDQWNRRWAAKWLKIAQDGDASIRPIFEKLIALEAENEQLGKQGDSENAIYLSNKLRINSFFSFLVGAKQPAQDAFSFPCIEFVETSGTAHLGKG